VDQGKVWLGRRGIARPRPRPGGGQCCAKWGWDDRKMGAGTAGGKKVARRLGRPGFWSGGEPRKNLPIGLRERTHRGGAAGPSRRGGGGPAG